MKALKKLLMGAALPILLAGAAAKAQEAPDGPVDHAQKQAIVRKALSLLEEHYIFPERIKAIETRLSSGLAGKYRDRGKLFAFLETLNADLEESGNDRHLDIFYGPAIVAKLLRDTAGATPATAPPEYLQMLAYENYRLRKAERMDGNIGYLKLNGFIEPEHSRPVLTAALKMVEHSSALILDLRENGGGSAAAANLLVSCFLPDSTFLGDFTSKTDGVTKLYSLREPGLPALDIPLYILVSARTSSAAEAVAYQLQQFKRATIVGEQTKGEANPGYRFPVTDQLYMMIPTAVNRNAVTGTNWDRVGVRPDIRSEPDAALPAAMIEACRRLGKDGRNDIYSWLLPEYEAQLHPQEADEKLLAAIIGRYDGGREIVREQGAFYYISGKQKRRLSYLGHDTFMLEGKREVRISFPGAGTATAGLTFLWNDGSSETVRRIQ